ncbi:MAG: hypothetical protein DRJ42_29370 [Deltaproteobacteria bacterium]|nr:MAG: hypothetical protein DRJ42_29370 [Deltaproteobacteria bacterium]
MPTDNAPLIFDVSPLDPFEPDAWASRLLNRGETLAAAGRFTEAVDVVGLVLILDPHNEVARARHLHHRAGLISKNKKHKKRADDTVRQRPRRTAAPESNPWTELAPPVSPPRGHR